MKPNQYQCAMCKEIYNKGRPDEVAKKELEEHHPGLCIDDCEVVCDDCYNTIYVWVNDHPEVVEEEKKWRRRRDN